MNGIHASDAEALIQQAISIYFCELLLCYSEEYFQLKAFGPESKVQHAYAHRRAKMGEIGQRALAVVSVP